MTRSFLIAAALLAFAGSAHAQSQAEAQDRITVSTKGLDLASPAGARAFYDRLSQAANAACGGAPTYALSSEQLPFEACRKAALDRAVAQARAPLVAAIHAGRAGQAPWRELASR